MSAKILDYARGCRDGNPEPDVGGVPPEAEIFFLTYILTDATVPYWTNELLEQPLEATLRSHQ